MHIKNGGLDEKDLKDSNKKNMKERQAGLRDAGKRT